MARFVDLRSLRPAQRRPRFRFPAALAGAGLAGFLAAIVLGAVLDPDGLLESFDGASRGTVGSAEAIVDRTFAVCASGPRTDCVVDGDTVWISGERVRIADIDTPEIGEPRCAAEAARGRQATSRMVALINEGPFEVHPEGSRDTDRYGRKLRLLVRDGTSLGETLIAEGLAERWGGPRIDWCAA